MEWASWRGTASKAPDQSPVEKLPPDEFSTYIGIFQAAGKALNGPDVSKARAIWQKMPPVARTQALAHIEPLAISRLEQHIPLPANHLRDEPWTRRAAPRTLPFKPVQQTLNRLGQAIVAGKNAILAMKW
jgi:hypothetical protein